MSCVLLHVERIDIVMWLGRERIGVKDVVDLRAHHGRNVMSALSVSYTHLTLPTTAIV